MKCPACAGEFELTRRKYYFQFFPNCPLCDAPFSTRSSVWVWSLGMVAAILAWVIVGVGARTVLTWAGLALYLLLIVASLELRRRLMIRSPVAYTKRAELVEATAAFYIIGTGIFGMVAYFLLSRLPLDLAFGDPLGRRLLAVSVFHVTGALAVGLWAAARLDVTMLMLLASVLLLIGSLVAMILFTHQMTLHWFSAFFVPPVVLLAWAHFRGNGGARKEAGET